MPIIKQGWYRFKEFLDFPTTLDIENPESYQYFTAEIKFKSKIYLSGYFGAPPSLPDSEGWTECGFMGALSDSENSYIENLYWDVSRIDYENGHDTAAYSNHSGWHWYRDSDPRVIYVMEDTVVDENFYSWFVLNTPRKLEGYWKFNSNIVPPIAAIDETITFEVCTNKIKTGLGFAIQATNTNNTIKYSFSELSHRVWGIGADSHNPTVYSSGSWDVEKSGLGIDRILITWAEQEASWEFCQWFLANASPCYNYSHVKRGNHEITALEYNHIAEEVWDLSPLLENKETKSSGAYWFEDHVYFCLDDYGDSPLNLRYQDCSNILELAAKADDNDHWGYVYRSIAADKKDNEANWALTAQWWNDNWIGNSSFRAYSSSHVNGTTYNFCMLYFPTTQSVSAITEDLLRLNATRSTKVYIKLDADGDLTFDKYYTPAEDDIVILSVGRNWYKPSNGRHYYHKNNFNGLSAPFYSIADFELPRVENKINTFAIKNIISALGKTIEDYTIQVSIKQPNINSSILYSNHINLANTFYTVCGQWKFNTNLTDELFYNEAFIENIKFSIINNDTSDIWACSGISFSKLEAMPALNYFVNKINNDTVQQWAQVYLESVDGWRSSAFGDKINIIDFGKVQQVSPHFYNWLQKNASPVEATKIVSGAYLLKEKHDMMFNAPAKYTLDENVNFTTWQKGRTEFKAARYQITFGFLEDWLVSSPINDALPEDISLLSSEELKEFYKHCGWPGAEFWDEEGERSSSDDGTTWWDSSGIGLGQLLWFETPQTVSHEFYRFLQDNCSPVDIKDYINNISGDFVIDENFAENLPDFSEDFPGLIILDYLYGTSPVLSESMEMQGLIFVDGKTLSQIEGGLEEGTPKELTDYSWLAVAGYDEDTDTTEVRIIWHERDGWVNSNIKINTETGEFTTFQLIPDPEQKGRIIHFGSTPQRVRRTLIPILDLIKQRTAVSFLADNLNLSSGQTVTIKIKPLGSIIGAFSNEVKYKVPNN